MTVPRLGVFARFWTTIVCVAVVATGVACTLLVSGCSAIQSSAADSPSPTADVFTPAHETFGQSVREFFAVKGTPTQPIEFPHKTHIAKDVQCTDCHESVAKGPRAGIPGLNTCMICHQTMAIAVDKPLIKQITAIAEKGEDLQWQRVYGYAQQAHVRFNHAPHIRAKVECSTCHGDLAGMTVATRAVDLNMGFCVSCHRQKNAPNECITCHF